MTSSRAAIASAASAGVLAALLAGASPQAVASPVAGSASAAAERPAGVETLGPIAVVSGSGAVAPVWPASVIQGGVAKSPRPVLILSGDAAEATQVEVSDLSSGRAAYTWVGTVRASRVTIAKDLVAGHAYAWRWRTASADWRTGGTFVMSGSTKAESAIAVGSASVDPFTGEVGTSWSSDTVSGPHSSVSATVDWRSGRGPASPEQPAGLPSGWRLSIDSGSAWAGISESRDRVVRGVAPAAPRAVVDDSGATVIWRFPVGGASRFEVQVRGKRGWRTVARVAAGDAESYQASVPAASLGDRVRVVAHVPRTTGSSRYLSTSPADVTSAAGVVVAHLSRAALAPSLGSPAVLGSGPGDSVVPGDAPRAVSVWGWDGSSLTFVRNASGVYEQVLTASSDVPGARNGLDRRLVDGAWVWELTDAAGTSTRFADGHAVSVSAQGMVSSTLVWNGDRLMSVRPGGVSADAPRALTFGYGGSGECASDTWTPFGFAAVADGQLCQISYGAGASTQIGYVPGVAGGSQIAIIKDGGNESSSWGWDSVGRLVATRSSLVTRSAVVDRSLAALVATIDYDDRGRAVSLRSAPARANGTSLVERISFPAVDESAVVAGETVTARITSIAGADSWSRTIDFNAASRAAIGGLDRAGMRMTVATDRAGRPSRVVDPQKRITSYTYNDIGEQTGQAGPFVNDPSRGLSLQSTYDATVEGSRTTEWTGLNVQVFAREDYAGDMTGAWWGGDDRSALGFSWSTPPSGASDGWSARASAKWEPASDAHDWNFRIDSRGATVTFIVNGEVCQAAQGTCTITGLESGAKSVEIQVNRAGTSGGFRVLGAPVGSEPRLIPASEVNPMFGVTTVQAINDVFPGSERAPKTVKEYSQPWNQITDAVTTPGGFTTRETREPIAPENDRWGRLLSRTTSGGKTLAFTYYGADEAVSPPAVCGGGPAIAQYGATKSVTRQSGITQQRFFNARGAVIAQVTRDAGGVLQTTCIGYDEAGAINSTRVFNADSVLIESTVTDNAVDGNPWIASTTTTHGPGSPTSVGSSYRTVTYVDMAGRTVRYVDGLGTVTTTTYTDQGSPETIRVEAPAGVTGAGQVLNFAMSYGANNWLRSITLNGVRVAQITYDSTLGRVDSITYADGASVSYGYFGNGQANSQILAYRGGRVTHGLDMLGSGRITGSRVSATGDSAYTEQRAYGYDASGRLISAQITSTQPGVPASTDYTYGFGVQAPRCAAGYASAGADSLRTSGTRNAVAYTTCHDAQGRTTSTTDPLVTGGAGTATMTHDRMGRVTAIDAGRDVSLVWGPDSQLARLRDGSTQTILDTFGGVLRDRQVVDGGSTSSIGFGYSSPPTAPAPSTYVDPLESPAPAPSMTYLMTGDAPTAVAASYIDLPGGAQLAIPSGGQAVLTVSDLAGAALMTVPMPSLGAGTASDLVPAVGPSPRFGPYGEALTPPTFDTASPHYAWMNAQSIDTLAGESNISLMGVRPYLPALGEFLAVDPDFNSGTNLYSYTSGDPINRGDLSGESETLDTLSLWLGVGGLVAAAFGPAGLALGAIAALGSTATQVIALTQKSEKPTVAEWVGVGATAFFGLMGAWSSFKALKDLTFFVKRTRNARALEGGGLSGKQKASTVTCIVTWSCASMIRVGARVRVKVQAETVEQAYGGSWRQRGITGRKGFWWRMAAPGG